MIGMERKLSELLSTANREGGFPSSFVCTEQGLLVAAAGEGASMEDLAALAALFDEVMIRAQAHLGMPAVDEVTVSDPRVGRVVIRPVGETMGTRMFLAATVPPGKSWRRVTNQLCARLGATLSGLGGGAA